MCLQPIQHGKSDQMQNLAKLDNGLDESPTVMVGGDNKQDNSVKKGAY